MLECAIYSIDIRHTVHVLMNSKFDKVIVQSKVGVLVHILISHILHGGMYIYWAQVLPPMVGRSCSWQMLARNNLFHLSPVLLSIV